MPRLTARPAAFLIEADNQLPCVMLDHAKAVEHAAWKHGRVEGLVRESVHIALAERAAQLEHDLAIETEARRQAQVAEEAAKSERDRARIDLRREMVEQGWVLRRTPENEGI